MGLSDFVTKARIITVISLLIVTPAGFYSKFYNGPASEWVNNSFGGLLYEIFWCLVFFLIFPGIRVWKIGLAVFFVTCLLEFLQLWNPQFLNYLRSFFIGQAVLGNSFIWSDFIYYFAGSIIGTFWVFLIKKSA
jgi:hypothetical protein